MKDPNDFQTFTLSTGNSKVEIEWIGEGVNGNYNPDDPQDIPLARFTTFKDGKELSKGSYCTQIDVREVTLYQVGRFATIIIAAIQKEDYKRDLESLTWLSDDDLENDSNYSIKAIDII